MSEERKKIMCVHINILKTKFSSAS